MDGSDTPRSGGGANGVGDEAPATVLLEAITFTSSNPMLKACDEDVGWRNAGTLCAAPAWTPQRQRPISHVMGEMVRIVVPLGLPDGAQGPKEADLHGNGSDGVRFAHDRISLSSHAVEVAMISSRPLPRQIAKLSLGIQWYTTTGATVVPKSSSTTVYVTMGLPRDDQQNVYQEDGVTLKRMDRAVAWVAPMRTLKPHLIVQQLMAKFPYYALRPSPKVPRQYHQPTYFNDLGGAWPMSDYVEESAECQAIVRLVRGVLRQVGIPGEARTLLVWSDPEIDGGKKAVSAYWDEGGSPGLSRAKVVRGQVWTAALVDAAVKEGKEYPASHTTLANGTPSPGLNRFEACLEFAYGGVRRLYGGGAGTYPNEQSVLEAFWGLLWVSALPHEGFRVEQIVTRYR